MPRKGYVWVKALTPARKAEITAACERLIAEMKARFLPVTRPPGSTTPSTSAAAGGARATALLSASGRMRRTRSSRSTTRRSPARALRRPLRRARMRHTGRWWPLRDGLTLRGGRSPIGRHRARAAPADMKAPALRSTPTTCATSPATRPSSAASATSARAPSASPASTRGRARRARPRGRRGETRPSTAGSSWRLPRPMPASQARAREALKGDSPQAPAPPAHRGAPLRPRLRSPPRTRSATAPSKPSRPSSPNCGPPRPPPWLHRHARRAVPPGQAC